MLLLSQLRAARPFSDGWLLFRHALLCLACIFLISGQSPFAQDSPRLMLTLENPEGDILYSSPVKNGSIFGIRYLHSVALSPVTDYFIIKEDGIWLDRTVYSDFGAGLPHAPEGKQVMRSHNGKLSISGYDKKLGSFQLRVGRVANHILLLMPGKPQSSPGPRWVEIPLDSIAEPGSAVTFAVRRAAS